MADAINTDMRSFYISGWDSKPDPKSVHAADVIGSVRRLHDRVDALVVQIAPPLPLGTDFGLGEVHEALLAYAIISPAFQGPSIREWLTQSQKPHFAIYVSTIATTDALVAQRLTMEHIGGTDRAIAYRTIEGARALWRV